MELVYKHEKPLHTLALVIGIVAWLLLLVGTVGIALVYALLGLLIYLFAQSAFIAHLRGNSLELGPAQLPDLYAQYTEACRRLDIDVPPTAYLMMSDGVLNALATRFLRRHYVVVFSSVVEALRTRPEALRFYFGHELAHIKRGHLDRAWLKWPALILPLLGAAYRRAQEYTCDLHGLAAANSPEDAYAALTVLASGGEKLPAANVAGFIDQQSLSSGFWMSYHELTGDYPWLCKRLAHLQAAAGGGHPYRAPRRHALAAVLAAGTPRLGVAGGGGSMLVMVAMIGILAAVAIPAYQDYTVRAQVTGAMPLVEHVQRSADAYVNEHLAYPAAPADVGLPETLDSGPVSRIEVVDDGFALYLRGPLPQLSGKTIVVGARRTDAGDIVWNCAGGTLDMRYRPARCRQP